MAKRTKNSKGPAKKTTKAPSTTSSIPQKMPKISILVYGDSPAITSGFSTVIRNVFQNLMETGRYHIDIFGISDRGDWKDPLIHPYHVYMSSPPGTQDPYGRSRFVDIVRGASPDLSPPWDIIFFLNDPFVLENPIPTFNIGTLPAIKDIQKTSYLKLPADQWFKIVGYWPVDTAVKPHWVMNAISLSDYPIAYTKYAKYEIQKANMLLDEPKNINNLKVIYHGNDNKNFHPISKSQVKDFRKSFFGGKVRDETFLVTTVARNQRRKDLPRTMQVFKEFLKRRPDSFLYIHAEESEMWGSLKEAAHQIGLIPDQHWNYPNRFTAIKGFPTEILNLIYNASDLYLSTTQGEGWGLPLTEAMAAKTPVMAPNITSIPEIFNTVGISNIDDMNTLYKQNIRGIPIKSGSTSSEWICHGAVDLERFRPLTNVDDAVQKMLWVYDNPKKASKITSRAHKWVNKISWQTIANKWDKLFVKVAKDLEHERTHQGLAKKRAKKIKTTEFPHYYKDEIVKNLNQIEI